MLPGYAPHDTTAAFAPVVNVTPAGPLADRVVTAPLSGESDRPFSLVPVSRSVVLLTLNQLAVMSQNGVELTDALETVACHCHDKRLKRSLQQIHQSVSGGQRFSAAVANYGYYFPATLAPMLAAAEATGEVPETLRKVSARLRGELQMRGTILAALIYPLILVFASVNVMAALIIGVLPQFSKVFASIGKPIPPSTQFLLSFGDFCRDYWLLIVPAMVMGLVGMFLIRRSPLVRRPIGRCLMYGPLIRNAYRPLQAGRNFRTIATMVRGGVPLLQSIRLTRRTTRDLHWQALLDRIENNLIDGLNASSAMHEVDFLPTEAAQMMATGERAGRVGEVLEDIGSFYEEEAERRIKRLVVTLEPLIILIMGVVVAGVVMSVMLPLLDVSTIRK